jgi:DNA-directed RNA polymerase specialized sigma24 family protein
MTQNRGGASRAEARLDRYSMLASARALSNTAAKRASGRPPHAAPVSGRQRVAEEMLAGSLSADELLRRYCTLVYAETGSYQETARRLNIDRRTVKDKVDPELLSRLES